MFNNLPESAPDMIHWEWDQYKPFFDYLAQRTVDRDSVESFLKDWTRLAERIDEVYSRLHVATTVNTTDEEADRLHHRFLDSIYPPAQEAEQKLKEKLLATGLEPEGFAVPLRNMRSEAELFRTENVPILAEEQKRVNEFNKIIGAQTIQWEGREVTLQQLRPVYQDTGREKREMAWRLAARRRLEDREKINELWKEFYASRQQLASNAGMNSYLDYRWQQMHRFDYTPADCETFRQAILEVAVPAATRVYQRRQERLGVDSLRPWDLSVDPLSRPPLRPFKDVDVLKAKTSTVFTHVDGELGQYFDIMIRENLLDLDNRKNKAPGGYCTQFPAARVPFIFMNSVGVHDNVQTLLHEGGHCFHVFESRHLPYYQQQDVGIEFAEVASMAMELLALPYIEQEYGGFYSPAEAARARAEHLEGCLLFWPYMAVVDAFQQWAYQNPLEAEKPSKCDAQWKNLWEQFIPGVDWSGLEDELVTGWHRKLHIFCYPLYYVEYGLAQLGAAQVWRNALEDQSEAVKNYRRALSLGGTEPLPELFRTAGAKFAFDASTLSAMVELLEENLVKQEELAGQE